MFRVEFYLAPDGRNPLGLWLGSLVDESAHERIIARLARLSRGAVGDSRSVGEGVQELRIDHGPGYRVYYARSGNQTLLLLGGGDKRTQQRDIDVAIARWREFKTRSR